MSYYGLLTVDYSKLEQYFTSSLDVNKDGKVDGNDIKTLFDKAVEVSMVIAVSPNWQWVCVCEKR